MNKNINKHLSLGTTNDID